MHKAVQDIEMWNIKLNGFGEDPLSVYEAILTVVFLKTLQLIKNLMGVKI